jgi:hypothetical protein
MFIEPLGVGHSRSERLGTVIVDVVVTERSELSAIFPVFVGRSCLTPHDTSPPAMFLVLPALYNQSRAVGCSSVPRPHMAVRAPADKEDGQQTR